MFVNSNSFIGIVSCLKDFKNETVFVIQDENILISFIDDNNVLIVNALIKLDNSDSDQSIIISNVSNEISVDLNKFYNSLKMCKSGKINISCKDNYLSIKIKENKKNVGIKIELLNIEKPNYDLSKITHTHSFYIDFCEIEKIIKDISIIGGISVSISIENDKVTFQSGVNYLCEFDNLEISNDDNNDITESYDIGYLLKIIKSFKPSEKVLIKMSKHSPLCFKFAVNSSFVEFYIAPKKINDD